jgi:hypothetical protein
MSDIKAPTSSSWEDSISSKGKSGASSSDGNSKGGSWLDKVDDKSGNDKQTSESSSKGAKSLDDVFTHDISKSEVGDTKHTNDDHHH